MRNRSVVPGVRSSGRRWQGRGRPPEGAMRDPEVTGNSGSGWRRPSHPCCTPVCPGFSRCRVECPQGLTHTHVNLHWPLKHSKGPSCWFLTHIKQIHFQVDHRLKCEKVSHSAIFLHFFFFLFPPCFRLIFKDPFNVHHGRVSDASFLLV